jgi:hypothetical protein
MTDIAIRVDHLSKLFHIGRAQQHHDTLRDVSILSRITGPTGVRAKICVGRSSPRLEEDVKT